MAARKVPTDEPQGISAPQPFIEIHAVSTPSPPHDLAVDLAQALARIDELTTALALAKKPEVEGGPGTGSAVTLVEYRGEKIYEHSAVVVAVRGGGVLGLVVRGDRERRVVDAAPHDASLGVADRVGYHGYTYADPLVEAVERDPGLEIL